MRPARLVALFGVCVVAAAAFAARPALAQDRPTVFLHGLASKGSDWADTSARLEEDVRIDPVRPTVNWRKPYGDQAAELQNMAGIRALPGTTVVIGHSNGGVVAREWSKLHPVGGVVTIGTPHRGAPLIHNFVHWKTFNTISRQLVLGAIIAFGTPSEWNWVWPLVSQAIGWFDTFSIDAVVALGTSLGLDAALPVAAQMSPTGSYLATLNSGTNLQREASAISGRVGISSIARNYYRAGVVRAVVPEWGDYVAGLMTGAMNILYGRALDIMLRADPMDFGAADRADALIALAYQISQVDLVYCSLVSSPARNVCIPNDGVLPVDTQFYPGAINLRLGDDNRGPAHKQQKTLGEAVLYDALVTHLRLPRRTATPPPPPGPGPGDGEDDDHEIPSAGSPDVQFSGDVMYPNDIVHSDNNRFHFMYQGDGNLVLFDRDWEPIWSSDTPGIAPGVVVMQHDGNFVMYDAGDHPVWESGTSGSSGAYLIVQNDGSVVIYARDGEPLWDTGTAQ